MGTLDDAIRQHLDLKRQTGAAESEVERLESEAFGPARREAAAIAAPVDPPAADELPPPPAAAPEPVAAEPPPAAFTPPPAAPAHEPESWLDDDEDEGIAPEMPSVAPAPTSESTAGDTRTAGSSAMGDYVAPDEEGDDLLEETPEFLQETPEHDRLWFEQKPPRDFDFDQ